VHLLDKWPHSLPVRGAMAATTTFTMEEVANVRNVKQLVASSTWGCNPKFQHI